MKIVALAAVLLLPATASAATITVTRPVIRTDITPTRTTRVVSTVTVTPRAGEVVTFRMTRVAFRHPLLLKASGLLRPGTTLVGARCQTSSLPYTWRINVLVHGVLAATNVARLRCA